MSPQFQELVNLYAAAPIQYPALRGVTLAQWILESGRGESSLAQQHLNFGGLKWRQEMVGFASPVSHVAHDGQALYCKFDALESFVTGYWRFLQRSRYTGWEAHAESPEDFIGFIGPIYASTAGYAERVLKLLPEANQLLASAAGPVPVVRGENRVVIVLDPGHGGLANHATSSSGVKEKVLALELALAIETELSNQCAAVGKSVAVHLTRRTDVDVGITARANLARETRADLFLSLHFNGNDRATRGTETFYSAGSGANLPKHRAFAQSVLQGALTGLGQSGLLVKDRDAKPDTKTKDGSLGVLNDHELGNLGVGRLCLACLLELEFIDHPAVDEGLVSGVGAVEARKAVAENIARQLLFAT